MQRWWDGSLVMTSWCWIDLVTCAGTWLGPCRHASRWKPGGWEIWRWLVTCPCREVQGRLWVGSWCCWCFASSHLVQLIVGCWGWLLASGDAIEMLDSWSVIGVELPRLPVLMWPYGMAKGVTPAAEVWYLGDCDVVYDLFLVICCVEEELPTCQLL